MTIRETPLPAHLAESTQLGDEISVTGKWTSKNPGGFFRSSDESEAMLDEWQDIHDGARADSGVLSTEIHHAVGEDAVLVHHVFRDADSLVGYFSTTASRHMAAVTKVANPGLHLVRGAAIPDHGRQAITAKGVPVAFGEHLFGYVKNDYRKPDPDKAVQVTAKWTCGPSDQSNLAELTHWWQQVGTEAFTLEPGLLRFETYRAAGEDALIIHETFEDSDELKFHLTKGTAEKYKKDIDEIAAPEEYFFRGPVAWSIRTYSKFMHLPATYSSLAASHTRSGGSMSDGIVE